MSRAMSLGVVALAIGLVGLAALLAAHGSPARAAAASPLPASPLEGVWGCDSTFGPAVRGTMIVTRSGPGWQVRIDGRSLAIPAVPGARDSLRFSLPDDRGAFRGAAIASTVGIEGFWIQPRGVWLENAYASPVRLAFLEDGTWRGEIVPLDDRYSLFVRIERDAGGVLHAVFRNPEARSHSTRFRYDVSTYGDSLWFRDEGSPSHAIAAAFDRSQRTLTIDWPDLGRRLVLTRREPAVGFAAADRSAGPYVYRPPAATGDGWRTARASTVGIDEAALTRLVRQIAATDAASDTTNWVQSIAVARHGTLVLDESFFAFDRERLHDLRSASKSFVSVLLGAEMLRGTPVGPASRVYGLFAAAGPFAHPDPRKAALTLAELMTHTSGLDADDNRDDSPGNEEHMQSQRSQPDWYRYTLDLPMIHDPGSTWAYSSAGMNLAGGAIGRATHAWLPWLVDRDIAAPLGITRYAIQLTPTGDAYMGGGMYLRPRDVLKLGQMMLDRGAWNGHAIVSPAWVDSSTVSRIAGWADSHEGYAWHLYTLVSGGRGHREIEANGNGGQILMILPELDLTVMITAGNYGSYRISRKCRDDLVARILIPAIRR